MSDVRINGPMIHPPPLGLGRANLNDVSTRPVAGISLPKGDLVYLPKQVDEGVDVFDRFEEGLDPANENPLDVTNDKDGLSVSVGGQSFTDGQRDRYNQTSVKPLQYSATAQRYLITNSYNREGSPSAKYEAMDQILINVDRTTKTAKVWMRQMEDGERGQPKKWSGWAEIVSYK